MRTLVKYPASVYYPTLFSQFEKFFNDAVGLDTDSKYTVPAVNVVENEKGYVLEVAAPGVKKEAFKIALEEDILTISAENKEEKEETTDKYKSKEFNYTAFKRSFRLSPEVDSDAISANYQDGVLYVQVPKKVEKPASTKVITVA
jgi:HSP20 family protein